MHDIAGAWEALKIDECALRRQQKAGRSRSRQILLPLPRQILLPLPRQIALPIPRGALPRQRHAPAPLPCGGATPPRHSPRKGAGHTKNGRCPVLTKFCRRPAKGECKQQIKPTAGVGHMRPAWQVTVCVRPAPHISPGGVRAAVQPAMLQCASAQGNAHGAAVLLELPFSFLPPPPFPPSPFPPSPMSSFSLPTFLSSHRTQFHDLAAFLPLSILLSWFSLAAPRAASESPFEGRW